MQAYRLTIQAHIQWFVIVGERIVQIHNKLNEYKLTSFKFSVSLEIWWLFSNQQNS